MMYIRANVCYFVIFNKKNKYTGEKIDKINNDNLTIYNRASII